MTSLKQAFIFFKHEAIVYREDYISDVLTQAFIFFQNPAEANN